MEQRGQGVQVEHTRASSRVQGVLQYIFSELPVGTLEAPLDLVIIWNFKFRVRNPVLYSLLVVKGWKDHD